MSQGSVVYYRTGDRIEAVTPDPSGPAFYRDLLFVHRFKDVFGHVVADADGLVAVSGEVFWSSSGVDEPETVYDFLIGNGDGDNGCWSPNPQNAVPEYVGVRFAAPVRVTGFRFATSLLGPSFCHNGWTPCGYPTAFSLEASNDEANWATLLSVSDFAGMAVAEGSPFADEDCLSWEGGVFLSDRLDVANDHAYLAYRMVVSGFKPDRDGRYSVAELIFYGAVAQ